MKIALAQLTSGIDPVANARILVEAVAAAAAGGAMMLFTPEMSGLLDRDRARASAVLHSEEDDVVLAAVRAAARAADAHRALEAGETFGSSVLLA